MIARTSTFRPMTALTGRWLRLGVIAGSVVLLLLQIALLVRGWDFYQYDFRAYYFGANLFAAGQDPYDFAALQAGARAAGLLPNEHPFLYPPYMLWIFRPLAWVSYPVAYFGWIALQVAALVVVIRLAVQHLGAELALLMPLVALGLNGSVAAVLRSGQLTLFLLAGLMAALVLVSRNRAGGATVLLTLAALPKLWLAPMLALLVSRLQAGRVALVIVGALAFAGIILAAAWIYPDYQARFADNMAGLTAATRVDGPQNGSALNMLRTGAVLFDHGPEAATVPWIAFVAVIGAASLWRFAQAVLGQGADPAWLFTLITLTLCLITPRLMVYQWVIALPGLAYVLTRLPSRMAALALLALALVPTLYINRYALGLDIHVPLQNLALLPFAFSNLVVVLVAWAFLVTTRPPLLQNNTHAAASDGGAQPATY